MSKFIAELQSLNWAGVLKRLDWQVEAGKVIGLLGRNGAGKTTLLECMLGLRQVGADTGRVELFGEDIKQLSDTNRARIGYVPQIPDLFTWLTAREMLDFFKNMYPRWNTAKVEHLLAHWGFNAMEDRRIGDMSLGEMQRLSIIRGLANDPDLLILDEPVASLDSVSRRYFLQELVNNVVERNTTVIFSTHILSDLERVAFDVAFLKNGKIALQGAIDELREDCFCLTGAAQELAGLHLPGVVREPDIVGSLGNVGNEARMVVRLNETQLFNLRKKNLLILIEPLNLEDLFVEMTR
jgi:ABC-2 type transport system ATP-binding protein